MRKTVYLVGAGPGDEDLITLKGLECIKKADVIVYDNLINHKLLSYAKPNAELIYVGKTIDQHTLSQEQINEFLIQKAREYKTVVRLKGGDPFVFGRGGEEAIALKEHNINFEIVPGVSSSIAALAYAGIPITHRGINTSFHVITGHEDPTKDEETVDYEKLAKLHGILVFLMGLSNLSKIVAALLKYGKDPETPVAVISKGTTPDQKVAVGTLKSIELQAEGLTFPAIIVVGEVVNLRKKIKWFEQKPLSGRRILVTRSRHQASILSKKIKELGGMPVEFPTIDIMPLDFEIKDLSQYQWVIFTSVNAVEIFFNKLEDIRELGNAKICAIGDATRQSVEKLHLKVDVTPSEFVAEALIEELKLLIKKGDMVLIPRAEEAREILPEQLEGFGAVVDIIPVYRTVSSEKSRAELKEILKTIDTITFASSSTVKNFVDMLGEENLNLLNNIKIACIGPITADTARNLGVKVDIMPREYTIEELVEALC